MRNQQALSPTQRGSDGFVQNADPPLRAFVATAMHLLSAEEGRRLQGTRGVAVSSAAK